MNSIWLTAATAICTSFISQLNAHDVANCKYVTIPVCGDEQSSTSLSALGGSGQKGDVGAPGKSGPRGLIGPKGAKGESGPKGNPSESLDVNLIQNMINSKLKEIKTSMAKETATDFCGRSNVSGIYTFFVDEYVCDGNGWTVVQRRQDGSVDFNRNWSAYRDGFGSLEGEFWIGLKTLNKLTRGRTCILRFDLQAFDGEQRFAEYSTFSVSDEEQKFQLSIAGYSGTAGDSVIPFHDGMFFTTKDEDNDQYGTNCATNHGGWWFKNCFRASPNAPYGRSNGAWSKIVWHAWKKENEALSGTTMKMRCE